jgi:uncharacterized protein (DUF58 family)
MVHSLKAFVLPPELLQKIQRIYIRSRYLANDVFSGEYESAFRGRGMEFEEVREYTPGDDVRTIDWNVSARIGHPYVKVFREEREQTVMLLVDASASGYFGSRKRTKKEVGTEIAAVLAYAAINSNDKVGLIIFSDQVEKFIPPKKGRSHVWHVISEILSFAPKGKGTNIAVALDYLNKVLHRRSIAFLISDFISENYQRSLRRSHFKHEMVALMVRDPLEQEFPTGGLVTLKDLETGRQICVDLNEAKLSHLFARKQKAESEKKIREIRSMGMDCLEIRSDKDYIDSLLQFFRAREKKFF